MARFRRTLTQAGSILAKEDESEGLLTHSKAHRSAGRRRPRTGPGGARAAPSPEAPRPRASGLHVARKFVSAA